MSAPFSILCLLLTAGSLFGLGPEQALYRLEDGKFTNTPQATLIVSSKLDCASSCSMIKSWFCGGFTYHEDGTCDLYRANAVALCVNPLEAAPPLKVDVGSESRSYRRLQQSTCPGTLSDPCGCPADFRRCAGRCLLRLGQEVKYEQAERLCGELDAHLVVPRSEAENQCALSVADGDTVWMGVTDLVIDGMFDAADGDCGALPVSGAWWRDGEPNNYLGEENCLNIYEQRWNDVNCVMRYQPLCQLSSCFQPQCQ